MKRALILTDGKAGHENQSRAFARALGCEIEVVRIAYKSKFHKALGYLAAHCGILTLSLYRPFTLPEGRFDLVLGTGSGVFYGVAALARHLSIKSAVVLYPRGYRLADFDCILAPEFDRPQPAANVIPIPANLVAVDPEFYARGTKEFLERHPFDRQTKRAVAVIVGGPNRSSTMTATWMHRQLSRIFDTELRRDGSVEFWVTTSRRTPPAVEEVVDAFPFHYKLLYSRDHFNPIPAFVSLADRLYVTAESTGMLSEACTAGRAQVTALDNLRPGLHKFRRFVDGLETAGYLVHADDERAVAKKIDLTPQFAAARQLLGL